MLMRICHWLHIPCFTLYKLRFQARVEAGAKDGLYELVTRTRNGVGLAANSMLIADFSSSWDAPFWLRERLSACLFLF